MHPYKIFQLHCGDNHTTNLHFLHDICVLLYFFYQRLALVCGNNNVIERLFSKKQQQEAILCSHNTFPVGGARESIQRRASLENSFTQLSKLVFSSDMLPNLTYIIKLLKTTTKMKTSILIYKYIFLSYICLFLQTGILAALFSFSEFDENALYYF